MSKFLEMFLERKGELLELLIQHTQMTALAVILSLKILIQELQVLIH